MSIPQCLAHEVFELLVDPYCNTWWQSANGTLFAGEVCDPVQNNSVIVNGMIFSDWILPKWTDAQATKGPFNHLNTLSKPFTMSKAGYTIQMSQGRVTNVFSAARQGYQIKGEPCLEKKTYLNRNVLSHREHYPESKLQ